MVRKSADGEQVRTVVLAGREVFLCGMQKP
nr:MAG TPA: hypothetical protein [Caudoviricetes sp.]